MYRRISHAGIDAAEMRDRVARHQHDDLLVEGLSELAMRATQVVDECAYLGKIDSGAAPAFAA